MASATLLVCSVFAGGQMDEFWLRLQHHYLSGTVGTFHHAVYLSHRANRELFRDCIVVGESASGDEQEHFHGLEALSRFCRHSSYRTFLILDSDAFPFLPNWEDVLWSRLERFKKTCAAAVRVENLDTFPHPCVVYTRSASALHLEIVTVRNLLGQSVVDVSCRLTNWFPLLRSNAVSLHPTLSSIYFDMFYHHGCGSRKFVMRAFKLGYYDHMLGTVSDPPRLLNLLQADSDALLATLSGKGTSRPTAGSIQNPWGPTAWPTVTQCSE